MTVAFDAFTEGLDHPVYIVTAVHRETGHRSGCLIGFGTQCGIEPPLFTAWISRTNHTHGVALASTRLAVHAPGADRHDLAALFGEHTGDDVDKFSRCAWEPGPGGVPLLTGCARRFTGRVVRHLVWGDHTAFLLHPEEVTGDPAVPPLMYSAVGDLRAGHGA